MGRARSGRGGCMALAFCVAILAALVLSSAPYGATSTAKADAAADAPAMSTATTTQLVQWTTSQLSGDFAVRLDMQFTELTACTFRIAGTGAFRPYDLLLYLGRDDDPERGGAMVGGGGNVVTVGPLGFQYHTTPGNKYWVGAITGTTSILPGRQAWVFAGFGLQPLGVPHPITDHSFDLRASCDRPFSLHGVDAAREAFGAANANLEEGVGFRISPPEQSPSANGNLADGVTRTTTTGSETLVIARDHDTPPGGCAMPCGFGGGTLLHLHPEDVAVAPFLAGELRYLHQGPPGEQSLRFNYLAAGEVDLYAMIIGFRPVGGVAGLDTWPALPTF